MPQRDEPKPVPQSKNPPAPTASVKSAVQKARREADASHQDVEAISAQHLKMLLSDSSLFLIEHIDDPELSPADRDRLLKTLYARRKTTRTQAIRKKSWQWTWPHWSARAIWRTAIVIALIALLVGPALRNTIEMAVVKTPFRTTVTLPNGEMRQITVATDQRIPVRRWLRRAPVAVEWIANASSYATAPIIRSAVRFPEFPYFDGAE